MWKLDRPQRTAQETFTICISKVSDRALKARLGRVTQAIVNASDDFDDAAGRNAFHEIARGTLVGGEVTRSEMEKVYSDRMVKKGAPGRDIYDELFGLSPQGRCPLCAQRPVMTLDHYLPKKHYPALAVAPLNLVPSCSDCNKIKLASFPQNAEDVPLHPYYDYIDAERWLFASVVQTKPSSLRFHVTAPTEWGGVLTARVRNHFASLKLAGLYAMEAAEELFSIRHQLVDLHRIGGMMLVRSELESRAVSCEAARRNGWRSASYQAWTDSDWFCNGGFTFV